MGRNVEGPEPSDSPSLRAYKEQCETSVNAWAAKWTLLLKAKQVAAVHVIYGAGEDDGGIEQVKYFRREGKKLVEMDESPLEQKQHGWGGHTWTEDPIEEFMYQLMQARGFFNQNEGCQGIIRWDIEKDMIIHDHQYNEYGEGGEIANPEDPEEDQYTETTYIPQEVETTWGVDDLSFQP